MSYQTIFAPSESNVLSNQTKISNDRCNEARAIGLKKGPVDEEDDHHRVTVQRVKLMQLVEIVNLNTELTLVFLWRCLVLA
jgi:hypothetical protein